jgi:dipeptidase E
MMLELWRSTGFADYLSQTVWEGKPAGGLSAGAICWFRVGNSDWPQYEGIPGVNTARLDGLNLVDLAACPHTKNEGFRLAEFREMMRTEGGVGIGLDDGCAIHILDDEFRILASQPNAVAHRIEWVEGALREESLVPHHAFRPLAEL